MVQDADHLIRPCVPLQWLYRLESPMSRVASIAATRFSGATKPRALVRALQMLYLAESIHEAVASLKPQTADEEALLQLTEREPV